MREELRLAYAAPFWSPRDRQFDLAFAAEKVPATYIEPDRTSISVCPGTLVHRLHLHRRLLVILGLAISLLGVVAIWWYSGKRPAWVTLMAGVAILAVAVVMYRV